MQPQTLTCSFVRFFLSKTVVWWFYWNFDHLEVGPRGQYGKLRRSNNGIFRTEVNVPRDSDHARGSITLEGWPASMTVHLSIIS